MSETAWTLVTGASEGIGLELARCAARNRRDVIVTARSKDKLEALASDLRETYGVQVLVIAADLAEPGAVAKMWAEASDGREIDFLINNAGLGHNGAFADSEGWAREKLSIDVNIVALTELMKLALPQMVARDRGRVLNVASLAAFAPGPGMAVYSAAKAYVLSLSEAANAELSENYISVTALCPGATDTSFFDAADMRDAQITKLRKLPTAASVAEAGYAGAIQRKAVVIPGMDNKITGRLMQFAPHALTNMLTKKLLSRQV